MPLRLIYSSTTDTATVHIGGEARSRGDHQPVTPLPRASHRDDLKRFRDLSRSGSWGSAARTVVLRGMTPIRIGLMPP